MRRWTILTAVLGTGKGGRPRGRTTCTIYRSCLIGLRPSAIFAPWVSIGHFIIRSDQTQMEGLPLTNFWGRGSIRGLTQISNKKFNEIKPIWRRERDSNPRYGFPYTHFPGVRLQPLGHLSSASADRSARRREGGPESPRMPPLMNGVGRFCKGDDGRKRLFCVGFARRGGTPPRSDRSNGG